MWDGTSDNGLIQAVIIAALLFMVAVTKVAGGARGKQAISWNLVGVVDG